jgi:uncharacterized protein (DUF1330 family)
MIAATSAHNRGLRNSAERAISGNMRASRQAEASIGGIVAAYVIYQGEVLDANRYGEYMPKAAASILAAGGEYLVRGGDVEVLEGEAPAGRTVVAKFPSMKAALDWYRSDEYTEIRKIREGAARIRALYVVNGVA